MDDSERDAGISGAEPASCYGCVIGRRSALMGMGALGLAGLLTACGDDDTADGTGDAEAGAASPTGEAGSTPASPTGETDTAEPEPEPSETGDGPAALASVGDVPVGGGVILNGPGVVITQPSQGEFAAFSSTCTHQGCAVTDVSDGLITCPCHGSQFSAVDGSVRQGPAQRPLDEVPIVVEGDQILRG